MVIRPLIAGRVPLAGLLREYRREASAAFGPFVHALLPPFARELRAGELEGLVAWAGGRAVGRAVGLLAYQSDRGLARISFLHVAAGWRDQGLEEELLGAAMASLRGPGHGARAVMCEAMVVSRAEPDAVFLAQGFATVPRQVMELDLASSSRPAGPLPGPAFDAADGQRCVFRPWRSGDDPAAGEVLADANAGSADGEIYPELLDPRRAASAMRGVAAGQCGRFDRQASGLAVQGPLASPIGLVLCAHPAPGYGFLVELAVRRAWQGRGLGRFMLQRSLGLLRRKRVRRVGLAVTLSNRAALTLYQDCGFVGQGLFSSYHWPGRKED